MSFILLGILNSQASGGGGGELAYDLLESTILTSNASSVTFTNLNNYSDYKHLQIRLTSRFNYANAVLNSIYVQINNDTGANYRHHYLNGDGSSARSSSSSNATRMEIEEVLPGSDVTANIFGAAIIDFLDFSNPNKNTVMRYISGVPASSENDVILGGGLWVNTAAVTEIDLIPIASLGNFITGSRFSLYGVK